MKKYNLSAEFMKWEGTSENGTERDSFDYVIEFESEEEAKTRLESLIIDKLSSKSGLGYKLSNSKVSEFPLLQEQTSDLNTGEQASLSEQPEIFDPSLAPDPDSPEEGTQQDQITA